MTTNSKSLELVFGEKVDSFQIPAQPHDRKILPGSSKAKVLSVCVCFAKVAALVVEVQLIVQRQQNH